MYIWQLARNLNLTRTVISSNCNQCFTELLQKLLYFAYNTKLFHWGEYCKYALNCSQIPRNVFSKKTDCLASWWNSRYHKICHQYSNISISFRYEMVILRILQFHNKKGRKIFGRLIRL